MPQMLVVLDAIGASARLRGLLSRRFLEMRAGLFVGSASARMLDDLWAMVLDENPRCAVLAHSARNELGLVFRWHGECATILADCDGLQLVMRRKANQNSTELSKPQD